jgi:murein L,D-transpeptidase YafK
MSSEEKFLWWVMTTTRFWFFIPIWIILSSHALGAVTVSKVYVIKSRRLLYLMHNKQIIKKYSISLGGRPVGHKQYRGDSRTPEGKYFIDYRNPRSRFTLSLHISYPGVDDRRRAQLKGKNPGGDIFIHGLPTGAKLGESIYMRRDWTDGCIAVSNEAIREIWRLVKNGTPIEIVP